MKRHNPSSASSPNGQFDLTPLLDVIFIFLFVVSIYAVELGSNNAEQIEILRNENELLADEVGKGNGLKDSYEDRLQKIEEIDQYVSLISIYTGMENPDGNDYENRVLRINGDDWSVDVNPSNQTQRYEEFKTELITLVEQAKKEDGSVKPIVFTVNDKNSLKRDYDKVWGIIHDIKDKYPYVY